MVRVVAQDQTIQLSEWYIQPWRRIEFLFPYYAFYLLSFLPPQLSTIRQSEKDRIKTIKAKNVEITLQKCPMIDLKISQIYRKLLLGSSHTVIS